MRALVGDTWVSARLLVMACGANYAFQRRFGLGLPRSYLHTAQRELVARRLGDVELHFGHDIAPGGFAWAVPIVRDSGTTPRGRDDRPRSASAATRACSARVAGPWGIDVTPEPPRQKLLPLGAIDRTVRRPDAHRRRCRRVWSKPTTGGGIHYSILSAKLASPTCGAAALASDRLDAEALALYERAWRDQLGEEFVEQRSLRDLVTRLSDREIDSFFELARTDGIMPIVRKTAQFNHHRHLIRALLRHPPARKILFRSIIG